MLPETDFPARQVRARLPGAIAGLEEKLAALWGISISDVRTQLWRNLKTIAVSSGAIETLPDDLADTLLAVLTPTAGVNAGSGSGTRAGVQSRAAQLVAQRLFKRRRHSDKTKGQ